jgi:cbb3-type cytochrome oxidase subunit 3
MDLIKEYLGSVAGVQTFGIISMLIFLISFLFLLFQTYRVGKDKIREYSRLPLEEDDGVQNKDN